MRWIITFLLALSVILLWRIKPNVKEVRDEVVRSERVVYNKAWRAQLEREMTIREMERYAAGLSDEELWREVDGLSRSWLTENAMLNRPNPPRLVILLGREIGKRGGLAGLDRIADYFYDLDDEAEGLEERGQDAIILNYLDNLQHQMETAVFGGYLDRKPHEAIKSLLSWWEGFEDNSVGGYYESLEDVIQSQMMGAALRRMAATHPDRAFEYLEKAQEQLPWSCKGMIGDFFQGLSVSDRDRWIARATELWPREQALFLVFSYSLPETKKMMIENPSLAGWEVLSFLKEPKMSVIYQLSKDESVSLRQREDFATHLFYNGHLPVSDILGYPIEIQNEVLSDLIYGVSSRDARDFSGPIDGRESTREQDRMQRIPPLERALEKSELNEARKDELLAILEEVKLEDGEE